MKKTLKLMTILLCVFSFVTFSSCTKDNGGEGNNTGIEFRMRNDGNDEIFLFNGCCYFDMSSSNNFIVHYGGEIASVGIVNNLSGIRTVPDSGWVKEIAAHPGMGYVIRYRESEDDGFHYARFYIEEWIESTSGGIIGALLWYQDDWKEDEPTIIPEPENPIYSITLYEYHDYGEDYYGPGNVTFQDRPYVCFEDLSYSYCIAFRLERLYIIPYERKNGTWKTYDTMPICAGLLDVGSISKIEDISNKNVNIGDGWSSFSHPYFGYSYSIMMQQFHPNHGYQLVFVTEKEEYKYVRIFAESYFLDNNGSMNSITIRYQYY